MSEENVEIVRGIYTVPEGITGATSDRLAPDVEFDFTSVRAERVGVGVNLDAWRGSPSY